MEKAFELIEQLVTDFKAQESAYLSPIQTIDYADETNNLKYDHIVKLVEQMLEAKEKLSKAKTEAEMDRLKMQCERLDRQIDKAVYELYGLTEEEVKVVEEQGKIKK